MEPVHKRQRLSSDTMQAVSMSGEHDEDTTDIKLAILASLHPDRSQEVLLDYLLAYDGSVDAATTALCAPEKSDKPRKRHTIGYQSSLSSFARSSLSANDSSTSVKALTRKGRTLHLYVSVHSQHAASHKLKNQGSSRY